MADFRLDDGTARWRGRDGEFTGRQQSGWLLGCHMSHGERLATTISGARCTAPFYIGLLGIPMRCCYCYCSVYAIILGRSVGMTRTALS